MRIGEIGYARAGEHHIAFREVVDERGGDQEIVVVNAEFWPMESLTHAPPEVERFVRGLAALGRVVLFDRRGVALSDPISDWELPLAEQWSEDLAAVIRAAGCDRPTVFSWHTAPIATRCAIRNPNLIGRLILFNPSSPVTKADTEWVARFLERRSRDLSGEAPVEDGRALSDPRSDPTFREWNDAAGRAGASPAQAARISRKSLTDPFPDFSAVSVPTLVITRVPEDSVVPSEFVQRAAHRIPNAELVAMPPGDGIAVGRGVDDLLAEISRYLTGEVRLPAPDRHLAAILFTDLVGSTRRAVSSGDAAWKRLLDRHDATSRAAVSRQGGEVVKTTGDGVLALLPSATAAIEAAHDIRTRLDGDDLQVRIGVHVGEIDRRGDDVSGVAVNTAARIMAVADPGQILTSTVVTLTTNAYSFTSLGPTPLKDLDGEWELHTVD